MYDICIVDIRPEVFTKAKIRILLSGLRSRAVWYVSTDVSEERQGRINSSDPHCLSTLKMEAVCFSKKLVQTYWTIRRHSKAHNMNP
jgi:hypothetical protein